MIKKIFLTSMLLLCAGSGFAQNQTHTVAKGETVYSLARKYGMSVNDFYRLNPSVKDQLAIGQKVKVMKGGAAVPKNDAVGYIEVQPKQTIYGITRQYHITEAQLRALNPDLGHSLQTGERLALPAANLQKYADKSTVPYSAPSEPAKVAVPAVSSNTYNTSGISSDNFVTYTVQKGDTTFGIINKFGISLEELIQLNPDLSRGLQPGMVLKVKKADKAYVKKAGDVLNVVLMLPFGYDSNDSKYRAMSLDFLAGAKLAIERNAKKGQKLDIKVVDAGNEASFKNSLTQINKDNTDLIIGPFFKSSVLEVLDYVKDSKIPVVAPFANSDDLYGFSNLIIVETNEQTYADRIIQEVKSVYSDQKIYIVGEKGKNLPGYLAGGLQKALRNPNVVVVNSAAEIQADTNMMTGQKIPVIAILASDQDATGQKFGEKMIDLSQGTAGMKAFSMYYVPMFEKYVDELSQASLVYIMDRKINTDGTFEKEILAEFNQKYCKSPGKYQVVGFDVMNDMLMRENNRGEIFSQMGRSQTQLATKFEFERIQRNGAYVNTGYRVVRLVP
ncbi:LysM peptidoglycan-binding domain-containing protein [Chryseobacterium sp. MFBS3-17]|uniref:amino acid ABC transporter substrate-binding protein n=1 Tax=Chryseobacterium sp. MFBS3-17 TaxID=2886689 RepID=UPI001D0F3A85|nr:LysM peptidoglycan-binding domain-containing protein [Chryseobacterium sp. MFBS3-17]MCC2589446.1 LysM peptidoglycan-binding domain-containing protein [Chryseobacterium sp. MFBS3-17]